MTAPPPCGVRTVAQWSNIHSTPTFERVRFFTRLMHSANRLPSKHANIFSRARSEPYHTHSIWIIYVSTVHMSHWAPSRTLLTASDTRVHTLITPKS